MIQNNFRKEGIYIQPHYENLNKNTQFTKPVNLDDGRFYNIDKERELASYKQQYHRTETD